MTTEPEYDDEEFDRLVDSYENSEESIFLYDVCTQAGCSCLTTDGFCECKDEIPTCFMY